eukprot:TRINITY_DN18474_c0_g1_i1.p1 TRINITY_DN18474_c0_g1~~TRINITY_DN18474_c0_g1_i1.p1  ORF type:complete len:295 (+),score=65.26 TRINITY_DN18474_c0_g1_i1:55-885(+)
MPVRVEARQSDAQEEDEEPLDEYEAAEAARKEYLETVPESMQYTPEKKKFDVEWSNEWRLTMAVEMANNRLTPAHLVIAEDMFGHLHTVRWRGDQPEIRPVPTRAAFPLKFKETDRELALGWHGDDIAEHQPPLEPLDKKSSKEEQDGDTENEDENAEEKPPEGPRLATVQDRRARALAALQKPRIDKIKTKFQKYDTNSDGTLDLSELTTLLRRGKPDIKQAEIRALFGFCDKNDDKRISFNEFVDWVYSEETPLDPAPFFVPTPKAKSARKAKR